MDLLARVLETVYELYHAFLRSYYTIPRSSYFEIIVIQVVTLSQLASGDGSTIVLGHVWSVNQGSHNIEAETSNL